MRQVYVALCAAVVLAGCLPSYALDSDSNSTPDASSDAATDSEADSGSVAIGVEGHGCEPDNALACAGHAQKLVLYCDPSTHKWTAMQSCSAQQLCDSRPGPGQVTCQDPVPECVGLQPGDPLCNGSTLILCGPDLVSSEQTPCENACVDGICTGGCSPGGRGCNGATPQVCTATGSWHSEAPCPYACTNGDCTGHCVLGATQCDGQIPQTCNDNGLWEGGAPCDKVCSQGACVDTCAAETKQCSGDTVQTCVGGSWQNGPACDYVCSAGECVGECEPGSTQCSGKEPQTCDAQGQWHSGDACDYVCSSGQCIGVCDPGSQNCLGLVPRTCNAQGQWESDPACPYLCNAGVCTGECASGAKQCSGQIPQTCEGGEWQSEAACPYVCTAGTCTGVCTPGTTQCSGSKVQTCQSSGQWNAGTACPYVCASGACAGVCTPGATQCSGNKVQTCQSSGQWDAGTACTGSTPVCAWGQCEGTPSCDGMTGTECQGKSCCSTILVPGGTFPMGRSTSGTDACYYGDSDERPEHEATVATFALDTYEVTVGRFRRFVEQYDGTPPAAGAAAHPLIAGTGWQSAWNASLPASQATLTSNLKCDSLFQTWTDAAAGEEQYAINCVSWYEALTFCAWDGGRLPTEAEWEYAAAGGGANRLYPWGAESPSANYALASDAYGAALVNVGSHPLGVARWGHQDLAGGMVEWAFDWYDENWYVGGGTCSNCANTMDASDRVARGGCFLSDAERLRAAERARGMPTARGPFVGFRCARTP